MVVVVEGHPQVNAVVVMVAAVAVVAAAAAAVLVSHAILNIEVCQLGEFVFLPKRFRRLVRILISFHLVCFCCTLIVLMCICVWLTVIVRGLPSSASWQDLKVWKFLC
jgi:hypothetical protein